MGLVWPSLQRCLVAWGCCLWEQCSTYEKLIENSCFQLPAVPQRTHQLSIIWSRSREKPPFSCGIKVWGVYIFIIPIDYFNLLQTVWIQTLIRLTGRADWLMWVITAFLGHLEKSHDHQNRKDWKFLKTEKTPEMSYFPINNQMKQVEKSNQKRNSTNTNNRTLDCFQGKG